MQGAIDKGEFIAYIRADPRLLEWLEATGDWWVELGAYIYINYANIIPFTLCEYIYIMRIAVALFLYGLRIVVALFLYGLVHIWHRFNADLCSLGSLDLGLLAGGLIAEREKKEQVDVGEIGLTGLDIAGW